MILRPSSEPDVHYGLVTSSNQVMRNAVTRDQLAAKLDIRDIGKENALFLLQYSDHILEIDHPAAAAKRNTAARLHRQHPPPAGWRSIPSHYY